MAPAFPARVARLTLSRARGALQRRPRWAPTLGGASAALPAPRSWRCWRRRGQVRGPALRGKVGAGRSPRPPICTGAATERARGCGEGQRGDPLGRSNPQRTGSGDLKLGQVGALNKSASRMGGGRVRGGLRPGGGAEAPARSLRDPRRSAGAVSSLPGLRSASRSAGARGAASASHSYPGGFGGGHHGAGRRPAGQVSRAGAVRAGSRAMGGATRLPLLPQGAGIHALQFPSAGSLGYRALAVEVVVRAPGGRLARREGRPSRASSG